MGVSAATVRSAKTWTSVVRTASNATPTPVAKTAQEITSACATMATTPSTRGAERTMRAVVNLAKTAVNAKFKGMHSSAPALTDGLGTRAAHESAPPPPRQLPRQLLPLQQRPPPPRQLPRQLLPQSA